MADTSMACRPAASPVRQVNGMTEGIDRRRFLGRAAMAIGAAHVNMFGGLRAASAESKRASRELSAIGRASECLNSSRLTPESLAGKVVLVQFCTYTCINWLRTLPYVRAWAQKYNQGLVVVGVHTPEFPFEHDIENVRRALQPMKITYPVVIDNDYAIWRAGPVLH
jgi:thiol-disulfide isomerase/thioredoxin